MIDANTMTLLRYSLQIKHRTAKNALTVANVEQLTAVAILEAKLSRNPTISEVRAELRLGKSSTLPALDDSPLVNVGFQRSKTSQTRNYSLTNEGKTILNQIFNPTK